MLDLAVVGQDQAFGGGVVAQTEAFLRGARELGREPVLMYDRHPTLAGRTFTIDRIEAIRQLRASHRLARRLADARSVWFVAPLATSGYAVTRTGKPYACWLATSLEDEWSGRGRGLDPFRRAVQKVNAPLLLRLERAVIRGATRLYATSPRTRATLAAAAGIDEKAIALLPIPVDVEALTPEPNDTWLARLEAPVLTFVGRGDDARKNLPLLLEALPLIRARVPSVRVRLIGRPPRELPTGVEVLGQIGSIAPALRRSTLLVLPSWQEGFGIVAAEALACGVPVVTTPSGGPEHLIRASQGGRVLSGWDAGELAETIVELLGDADTLTRMRVTGRAYVAREHSPDRFRSLLRSALLALDDG